MAGSRFDYVKYDAASERQQMFAKEAAVTLEAVIDTLPKGRAQALAYTKLEETYMWIGKSIRDGQQERDGSAQLQETRKNG